MAPLQRRLLRHCIPYRGPHCCWRCNGIQLKRPFLKDLIIVLDVQVRDLAPVLVLEVLSLSKSLSWKSYHSRSPWPGSLVLFPVLVLEVLSLSNSLTWKSYHSRSLVLFPVLVLEVLFLCLFLSWGSCVSPCPGSAVLVPQVLINNTGWCTLTVGDISF